jgi:hypothetical protein
MGKCMHALTIQWTGVLLHVAHTGTAGFLGGVYPGVPRAAQ